MIDYSADNVYDRYGVDPSDFSTRKRGTCVECGMPHGGHFPNCPEDVAEEEEEQEASTKGGDV